MRVLVTGATGVFGRDVVRRLIRDGHDVVGLSRRVPDAVPHGMTHFAADVRDTEAVTKAMVGCDAVVHLAWTVMPHKDAALTRAVDVGGTISVLDAMEANGTRRLVQASSVMTYGALADNPARLTESDPLRATDKSLYSFHKREVEGIIAERDVDALMIRATSSVGRRLDGIAEEMFAGLALAGVKGEPDPVMQFVHAEDIGRLFALGVSNDWTGPVNLAPPDTVTMREIAEILGRRYLVGSMKTIERVATIGWRTGLSHAGPAELDSLLYFPIVDTTRLTEELGFRCGWTSRECVEDFARASRHFTWAGRWRIDKPWLVGYRGTTAVVDADPRERYVAAPDEVAGEFDTTVNPALDIFTSNNTSEAFPGPLTALSLELGLDSLRVSAATTAEILALPAELRKMMAEDALGCFGHSIYANTAVVYQMARAMPGYDAKQWDTLIFGGGSENLAEPTVVLGGRDKLRLAASFLPKLMAFGVEARRVDTEARALARTPLQLAALTDEALLARLPLLKDATQDGWVIASNLAAFVAGVISAVERIAGEGYLAKTFGGTDDLASAAAVRATRELASMLRGNESLQAAVASAVESATPLDALAITDPAFAARAHVLLDEWGHRGPSETELSALPYADQPALLLEAALLIAQRPEPAAPVGVAVPWRLRLVVSKVHQLQRHRELARDAAIRTTHAYRLAAREWGSRLTARGVLADPSDAFHLTLLQLLDPPGDVREIVARRRAERDRLAATRVPTDFVSTWVPEQTPIAVAAVGDVLAGIGVSSGTARGRVRVMQPESLGDLESGEVLVATLTDTGWTPLFAAAEAVVTQVGGVMSHAAVVAREFGIPCVVNIADVAMRLEDGQMVEVDGAAGTVRVLS